MTVGKLVDSTAEDRHALRDPNNIFYHTLTFDYVNNPMSVRLFVDTSKNR
jgi:hypothetical protein